MIRLGVVFLTIAVVAGLPTLLPVAGEWQMLSRGGADGTGRGIDVIVDLWRSLVATWQTWGVVSGSVARAWIGYFLVQRPKLRDATAQALEAVARSELEVQNLLLDPDLQVFGEPVSRVGQDLRSVRLTLHSIETSHVL